MTPKKTGTLILAGAALAHWAIEEGVELIVPGEMGTGNTTPAAALTEQLLNVDAAEVTGRGTVVDDAALARADATDHLSVLAEFGGYETPPYWARCFRPPHCAARWCWTASWRAAPHC